MPPPFAAHRPQLARTVMPFGVPAPSPSLNEAVLDNRLAADVVAVAPACAELTNTLLGRNVPDWKYYPRTDVHWEVPND